MGPNLLGAGRAHQGDHRVDAQAAAGVEAVHRDDELVVAEPGDEGGRKVLAGACVDGAAPGEELPGDDAEGPRGRLGSVKSCALPENWLQSRELSSSHRLQLQEAELSVSGG